MSFEDQEAMEEVAEVLEEGAAENVEIAEQEIAEGEAETAGEPAEQEQQEESQATAGAYSAKEVNDQIFEELRLSPGIAAEVQNVWNTFLRSAESREAAGEAIYAALFDSAPSLQSLFKTPRAVMAMRFMNGLNSIIGALDDPKALKVVVETLGFQHLDLEVTVPRVVIFRDAIVDLLSVEMGARFGAKARDGWCTFLNYVGGSYIFIRMKFAERLKILNASWAQATKSDEEAIEGEEGAAEGDKKEEEKAAEEATSSDGEREAAAEKAAQMAADQQKAKKKKGGWFGGMSAGMGATKSNGEGGGEEGAAGSGKDDGSEYRNTSIPTTFDEMFMFNAAVMGFGNHTWMNEVLSSFDAIVRNVSKSFRLQEECDVLALRMAKYKGTIVLSEYKAVMLASLRSLVKDWSSQHEVSWSWLWENVERMIKNLMGKPTVQEKALTKLYASLDDAAMGFIRREVYAKFFTLAPAGQDYFKQSTTRLHFIADKLVVMVLDMYKEPKRMVEDISALGLRHVGYGIPTDLFGPFVTGCVQVVRMLTDDDAAEDAFRWSLSLISRILGRVINEGSTIVMKAINANSGKQLKKAVGCAPRGKRALWMLNVQVGTQSISPLMWAIETGSLESAKAIIVDLLTIRADRDRYYYGMDIMFERHDDIIRRLCVDAPALLPTLLDGLIWRSRVTEGGQRRVNYYIKHLILKDDGEFSRAIEWITDNRDPKLVCHPVVSMVTDIVWSRVAFRTFLWGKTWFLFTLIVFIMSQCILNHLNDEAGTDSGSESGAANGSRRLAGDGNQNSFEIRVSIFACRCFIYLLSMGANVILNTRMWIKDIRQKNYIYVGKCPVPAYLGNWQDLTGFLLTGFLFLMFCMEPILHCMDSSSGDTLFTEHCEKGEDILFPYSIMATSAILLYFLLLTDLSVFSTRVSAFVLVCGRVLSEVALFLFGLTFFVIAFACAVSALEQDDPDFAGIPMSGMQLLKITLGMFSGSNYDSLEKYPALMISAVAYVITTVIFLLNLLIAQLNCAYQASYLDMLGFARLNRGKIVTDTMPAVPRKRWQSFTAQLKFDERIEFGEGDIGLAGGMQVWEPASANITTVDMIRRFGGSTSVLAQWPEEENAGDDEEDRFDRLEKVIERAMKRMSSAGGTGAKKGGAGSSTGQSASAAEESVHESGSE